MKLMLCCGGTGGHIYPALAIAERKTDCFFIGGNRLEKTIVPQAGFRFYEISAHPRNPFKILIGFLQALIIIWKENPDKVLSTGGYVTVPSVLAALILRKPVYIQEQNVLPGKVNRLLSHWAQSIFIAYTGASAYFPANKTILTGNPIRKAIEATPYNPQATELLVFGGSLAAKSINQAAYQLKERFPALSEKIIHLDGTNYCHDMASVYARASLVICRAGATSLAELAAIGLPAILIPYPHAADNHQEINARFFVAQGAAKMILDQELTAESLCTVIQSIQSTPGELEKMHNCMKKLGSAHAATTIDKYINV